MGKACAMLDAGQSLCTECGICCSGAIFDYAQVDDTEIAPLAEAGLSVDHGRGKPTFPLPCQCFTGRVCGIYQSRPTACRNYKCLLLAAVTEGTVDLAEAQRLVAKATAITDEISANLPPGKNLTQSRTALRRSALERAREEWLTPELMLDFYRLNLLLDRHFRRPEQRFLVQKTSAEGVSLSDAPDQSS